MNTLPYPYPVNNICHKCHNTMKSIGQIAQCTICEMKRCTKCEIQNAMRKNTKFCERVGCFYDVHDNTDFCEDCTETRLFLKESIKNTYKQLKSFKKQLKRYYKNPIILRDYDKDDTNEPCPCGTKWCPNPNVILNRKNIVAHVKYDGNKLRYFDSPFGRELTNDELDNIGINRSGKCTYAIGLGAKEVSKEEFDNYEGTIKRG